MTTSRERLAAAFPDAELGASADGHPFIRVEVERVVDALQRLRDELGYGRFVDLTAVDVPARPDRFELNYLLYSMTDRAWLRLKTRTAEEVPSVVTIFPAADWYERELFDLFGITVRGHPNLRRILLPDDWQGHPLRRDEPAGREPVDFTVTRSIYGT